MVLGRLAAIESRQRLHSQLLQAVLQATQKQELLDAGELPEGVALPLTTVSDLASLEQKLDIGETMKLMVSAFCSLFAF
jgi:hypothetical protein